ncbi:MAG: ferredoxin [Anaerohalosphaera sp.]|nr:ferredoxin [Anaerohalosphaera sp.]
MKVRVEKTCTACGLCVEFCPDIFRLHCNIAEPIDETVPPEWEDTMEHTALDCPVEAIIVE